MNTWAVSFAAALASLSGCSLAGFDSFELPACGSDVDCDSLNRRTGTPLDACNRFVCSPMTRKCVRRSLNPEVCDGVDNDCNGLVDENVIGIPTMTITDVGGGRFGAVGFTSTANGVAGLATLSAGGAGTFVSVDRNGAAEMPKSVTPTTAVFGFMGNASTNWPRWLPSVGACSTDRNSRTTPCSMIEAAIAPGRRSTEWFALVVDPVGCRFGRLRAGLLDTSSMNANFEVRGPLVASNVVDGIDVEDGAMGCSGRARTERGVARPMLSASPANSANEAITGSALGVWLGAPQDRPLCGVAAPAAPVRVEALGFSTNNFAAVASATSRPIVATSAPMGVPIPEELGTTRGGGTPAIVALPSGGWIVGFADAMGNVTVRTVADFTPTVPFLATEPFNVPRTSASLTLGAPFTIRAAGRVGPADHVSLAVRSVPGRAAPLLGVAWVEGCGAANNEVHLAQLEMNNGTFVEQRRAVVARDAPGAVLTAVIGLDRGLIDRGHPQSGNADLGGWLVSFLVSGSMRGARVLGADFSIIDSPPAILVETGVASVDRPPLLFSTARAAASVAWFDTVNQMVRSAPVCGTTRAPSM